jgi:peptide/nickel transport system permease protein
VPVINASPAEALILPVLTIAVPIAAPLAQVLIRSIDDTVAEPFVAVARSRGAGPGWVLSREVARNALLPTLTIAGVLFGELVAGAVVTETVFARTGLGRLTQEAVANRDIPVLQAIVVISAIGFVLVNLAVDLVSPAIDPRLRRAVHA